MVKEQIHSIYVYKKYSKDLNIVVTILNMQLWTKMDIERYQTHAEHIISTWNRIPSKFSSVVFRSAAHRNMKSEPQRERISSKKPLNKHKELSNPNFREYL